MRFLDSGTVPKHMKGALLGFFDNDCIAKYRNKRRETLWCNPKKFEKSREVPEKKRYKNTKTGPLVCSRGF